jgi:transposase
MGVLRSDGLLEMSVTERERLFLVRQVVEKRMRLKEAAERMGLCERQARRLVREWQENGDGGLVSRQRGRVSPRRMADGMRAVMEELLRGKLQGFGPTLAAEKLLELEGITVSRESVRKLQIEMGIWRPKRRQARKAFNLRERRARFGELVQIDGSPHDWFEGRAPKCTLIVFIDDATGRLTALHFVHAETSKAYCEALRRHILEHGVPVALYSDRHGIFRVNAKDAASGDGKTEFNRITERLKIEQICALTPQAKGRVERANQTLQDRLVKEMRLAGVSGIAAGDAFLKGFMARHNARFAVEPRDVSDAHRPWASGTDALDEVLARRQERMLSRTLTFRAAGGMHCVKTSGPGTALRGAKVTLLHFQDGRMQVRYKDRTLPFTTYKSVADPTEVEDGKTIDARVDAAVARLEATV